MDVSEAIHARQSIGKVRPDPLPRAVIERLLDAAAQAPNHFRVRPWRFFVLTGDARSRLGDVMAESLKQRSPDSSQADLDRERSRPLRAPVVIAVAVDPPAEPKVIEVENICAAAAAVQNLLLGAAALGLGGMWRTGQPAYDPAVKAFFGLDPAQHIIGFIYLGYPEIDPQPPDRPSYADRTVFLA